MRRKENILLVWGLGNWVDGGTGREILLEEKNPEDFLDMGTAFQACTEMSSELLGVPSSEKMSGWRAGKR